MVPYSVEGWAPYTEPPHPNLDPLRNIEISLSITISHLLAGSLPFRS
jgi:hypothetical protein